MCWPPAWHAPTHDLCRESLVAAGTRRRILCSVTNWPTYKPMYIYRYRIIIIDYVPYLCPWNVLSGGISVFDRWLVDCSLVVLFTCIEWAVIMVRYWVLMLWVFWFINLKRNWSTWTGQCMGRCCLALITRSAALWRRTEYRPAVSIKYNTNYNISFYLMLCY